jgi:putative transposase
LNDKKQKYRSKSIRLQCYDYRQNGYYFVTICTKDKISHFGKIFDGERHLNEIGETAGKSFKEIPGHFTDVDIDYFTIMPNHVHGIVIISRDHEVKNEVYNRFSKHLSGSLSVIVQQYKAAVKKWCGKNGYAQFSWQPRFYEHIIRNEESLFRIRKYIKYNHLKWEYDTENLNHVSTDEKKVFWKDFFKQSAIR